MRGLIQRVNPCLVSDHLSWSSINGQYLHDLLPLPYTEETLQHVVERIKQVQDYLDRQILIENISSYVTFNASTLTEWDYLRAVAEQSGCGILLDINNMYVNATNHGFNPLTYLAAIPPHLVHELHLGGFADAVIDGKQVLIDSHNQSIVPGVWDLYRQAIQHLGTKPTIIEWDTQLPSLAELCSEASRAEEIIREGYATTPSAS